MARAAQTAGTAFPPRCMPVCCMPLHGAAGRAFALLFRLPIFGASGLLNIVDMFELRFLCLVSCMDKEVDERVAFAVSYFLFPVMFLMFLMF